jgi:hypothetical protein
MVFYNMEHCEKAVKAIQPQGRTRTGVSVVGHEQVRKPNARPEALLELR